MRAISPNCFFAILSATCLAPVAGAEDARKPFITAEAEAFVKEAVADPKGSEARLKGKVVELTGRVSSAGRPYTEFGVTLVAGKLKPTDFFGLFADCEVPDGGREKTRLLAMEQKIRVVGEVKAVEKDRVRLTGCTVTELEPNPIPKVNSVDLAAAYAKSPAEGRKKYPDEYRKNQVFLSGKIVATEPSKFGLYLLLEGSGGVSVRVGVDKTVADQFNLGDTLRCKGRCLGPGYGDDQKIVTVSGDLIFNLDKKK